ncbi:hypothetical protein [Corallococcus llansteffanensis]|uniref:Uncharacterized protein n=1 Tax=Corallococcus llansteffanensis TaxID=2316731 RepID=A0A3A8QS46_9BACT|nr:hypothetical protein [Corallococcus llansteffanensis]RKH67702.1 hypothetical protein D7V93_02495 [Corallococcus llansteffanensis]
MGNRGWAVLWLGLLSIRGAATASPDSKASVPNEPPRSWASLTRLEVATLVLLPHSGRGETEGFVQLEPTLVLDGGPEFGINLGAPVRLRPWGEDTGFVRKQDWDSLSDFGQVVRGLKLGSNNAPVGVWFGALESYSLLSAHLVRRYSNRSNPDYHPAGGFLTGTLGPLYTQAFASDVLGARLMGAEVALDLKHVLFGQPREPGRYTLALSAVHDWGKAGGRASSVTLAHLDGTAVVVVRPGFEAHLLAGWGGRPGEGSAWGAVVGAGAEAFSWGRVDVDGHVAVQLFARSLEVAVKGLGMGMGQAGVRYLGAAEARWRLLGGQLYAMGTGGTLLFPTPEGTLRPGAFASVGLGVDNAR